MTMSILELLQHIVNEPAPRLSPSNYWSARDGDGDEEGFPEEAESFVDSCLLKDPEQRKTPRELLVSICVSFFSCLLCCLFLQRLLFLSLRLVFSRDHPLTPWQNHPWILLAKRSEIDVESWASRIP